MQNRLPPNETKRLLKLATYASVSIAFLLITTKLIAWLMSDSVSLLATLIDSCLDAAASLLNLYAIKHALQPADDQHRFGHGKAESLASLGQSAFIAGSAVFLLLEAGSRLFNPHTPDAIGIGIAVMIFSIFATFILLFIQRHVIKKTNSTAIQADSLHYKMDVLINCSVIISLLLASMGSPVFDSIIAIAIAGFILHSAWKIGYESVQLLMDRELPDDERRKIEHVILQHTDVRGMHDLRTRRSGMFTFIQLHLELDDELSLIQAHTIADNVELALLKAFPDADVIIHQDPASVLPQFPDLERR
ncbi:MAG TPA: cation diffusion facilitator family transporter [Gammaproteobacteria bacterium]|nr:cation diffusion facilitator family transporter [Gammaproteobacteria bacterium]